MATQDRGGKDAAVLVLSRAETESLLDPDELRQALGKAMVDVSEGRASMPPRIAAEVHERDGLLVAMPAYLPDADGLAAKLVSLFPHNAGTRWPTHQAVIVVFDAATGAPAALIDGTSVTAARTAAGSALATDLLARHDARVLAILGTGVQARSHAHAVTRVRTFDEVRVCGRNLDHAEHLVKELASELGCRVVAVDHFDRACSGAQVVCATTHSPDPVVVRTALDPGTHVNSVGYNTAGREVDGDTVAEALVVVESKAAVLALPPSGSNDIRVAIAEGRITEDHVSTELGQLIAGTRQGRRSDDQLTLYKSVGIAAQDVAAAALVLRVARDRGVGTTVDL
jgi:ornithine cyclodeaminase/alanine dehydrogenase-like protein (mu-crystallin family)